MQANKNAIFFLVTVGCGASSSENCTYFDSSSPVAGTCNMEICPCGDNICQVTVFLGTKFILHIICTFIPIKIRLDFNTFTIAGPSTVSTSVAKRIGKTGVLNGIKIGTTAPPIPIASVSDQGNCRTDTFSVTNPDGVSPPTICGVNTGEHSYVSLGSE